MLDSRRIAFLKVVLPFHDKDVHLANDLLTWCRELGGCPNHDAILVADAAVQWSDAHSLLDIAQGVFNHATMLHLPNAQTGWPSAANAMWLFAAKYIESNLKDRWLWFEPDCVPLKSGWLDAISSVKSIAPFLGPIITGQLNCNPFKYMNGVCVYPPNAASQIEPLMSNPNTAWDVAAASLMLSNGVNTPLIFCWWGLPGFPPSFSTQSTAEHVKTLDWIPKEAVLFHRCKDGSLTNLLRNRLARSPLMVVLPFCNKDSDIMLRTLQWMAELHGKIHFDALLCYPRDVLKSSAQCILKAATEVFRRVDILSYHGLSTEAYPCGANKAWQTAARHMVMLNRPWLFLEPDAIPIVPNWLDQILARYHRFGKPFMGAIVPTLGHMNGVGIYPADAAGRCPNAMKATSQAWDWVMSGEMISDCQPAGDLIFHLWGIVNGKPHPFQGEQPHFATIDDVRRWIPTKSVLVHRNKDNSLVERLHENLHSGRQLFARPAVAHPLPA